ncbi:AI-2E family transporter [Veillonella intestinalis]|uniref:AI-2E family transporter n=1 Tax=Veillonella intestinalis TaxID=2941341 RepID=UPI002041C2B2|nr:AI-2E family transporter [Veillonella intestinalis]
MNFFKEYKSIIGLIILSGLVLLFTIKFDSVLESFRMAMNAIMPLIWGVLIAFILNIIVKRFERIYFPTKVSGWQHATRRPVCVVLAILAVLLAIFLVGRMAIPQLVHSLGIIVQALPDLYKESSKWVNQFINNTPYLSTADVMNSISTENIVEQLRQIGADSGRYIVQTMSDAFEMVFNLVIGLIFAIYVLLDKEALRRQFGRLARAYGKEKHIRGVVHVWRVASQVFSSFFVGQFLDAVILGVMVGIGLWCLSVPYAMTIGCVIGLTALVPLLGAYIGGFMGLVMLLSVSMMDALIFIIVLVVMQQIEGNVIYPRLVGGSVGLPGIWVFAAITIGGTLYGVPGILLSVPLAATIYKLLKEDVDKRLEEA